MFKKILSIILLFTIFLAQPVGFATNLYTTKTCYLYQKPSTSSKKVKIKKKTKLTFIKTVGKFYYIKVNGKKAYILKKYTEKEQKKKQGPYYIDWNKGNKLWETKSSTLLYLIDSNKYIEVKRCGGLNHFDVEPLTEQDAAALSYYSWDCHPAILYLNTKKIPCSYNTMPHGKQTIDNNNFDGHFCIHLIGSKTHGTNTIQTEHQKAIERAKEYLAR